MTDSTPVTIIQIGDDELEYEQVMQIKRAIDSVVDGPAVITSEEVEAREVDRAIVEEMVNQKVDELVDQLTKYSKKKSI